MVPQQLQQLDGHSVFRGTRSLHSCVMRSPEGEVHGLYPLFLDSSMRVSEKEDAAWGGHLDSSRIFCNQST